MLEKNKTLNPQPEDVEVRGKSDIKSISSTTFTPNGACDERADHGDRQCPNRCILILADTMYMS